MARILVKAYQSSATYTLTAQILGNYSTTQLQAGVPFSAHVPRNDYVFFRYDVARLNASIDVAVTVITGDPDLFASFVHPFPTQHADDHDYES